MAFSFSSQVQPGNVQQGKGKSKKARQRDTGEGSSKEEALHCPPGGPLFGGGGAKMGDQFQEQRSLGY